MCVFISCINLNILIQRHLSPYLSSSNNCCYSNPGDTHRKSLPTPKFSTWGKFTEVDSVRGIFIDWQHNSYTHYYQIKGAKSKEWKAAWPKLIRDAQKIVDAESQHVQLADADGEEYGSEDEDFPPPVIKEKEGIELNGVSSSAHEPLILTLDDEWKFCKTEEKPYDVAVGCILLRAYTLVPEKFELR